MPNYYDGTKLLSLKDINGNTPELYLCVTNRTAGKTTYFGRFLVNKYLNHFGKFGLLYRFDYELQDAAEKFFKDISALFFPGMNMTSKSRDKGKYFELFLNDISCGYALALNNADRYKKESHLFSDINRLFMDEFQSETNHYCSGEIDKFLSIHTSIARGQGKQRRYVPVYMCSNAITLLNPYYTALNISSRLNKETKFLKGDGFVLEQGYNEEAARAILDSGISRAFSNCRYVEYSAQNLYLNDNYAFIEKPEGIPKYLATVRYNGNDYAVKEYLSQGIIYCDDKPDLTYPGKLALTTDDHRVNYVMLRHNDLFVAQLRYYFDRGCFRFKNLKCKEVIMKALSY